MRGNVRKPFAICVILMVFSLLVTTADGWQLIMAPSNHQESGFDLKSSGRRMRRYDVDLSESSDILKRRTKTRKLLNLLMRQRNFNF